MKLLLIHPIARLQGLSVDSLMRFRPLSLEVVAAAVPEHEVRILDLRFEQDWMAAVRSFGPDVVGITTLTSTVYVSLALCQAIKAEAPEVITLIGGQHATLRPQDFQAPYIDVITQGEAEVVLPPLLARLEATGVAGAAGLPGVWARDSTGDWYCGPPPAMADLAALRPPRRDLTFAPTGAFTWLDGGTTMTPIEGSRGCLHTCSFCTVWKTYQRSFRTKPPAQVADEVGAADGELVMFVDDNALQRKREAAELAAVLRAAGHGKKLGLLARADMLAGQPKLLDAWCEAGLYTVFVGFEALRQSTMDDWDLGKSARFTTAALQALRERGLYVIGSFVIPPDFTHDDFDELAAFLDTYDCGHIDIHILTPLPGTPLYDKHRHELESYDWRLYDGFHALLPTRMPLEEFYAEYVALYLRVWRHVRNQKHYEGTRLAETRPQAPVPYPFARIVDNYRMLRNLSSHHAELTWGHAGPPDREQLATELPDNTQRPVRSSVAEAPAGREGKLSIW